MKICRAPKRCYSLFPVPRPARLSNRANWPRSYFATELQVTELSQFFEVALLPPALCSGVAAPRCKRQPAEPFRSRLSVNNII